MRIHSGLREKAAAAYALSKGGAAGSGCVAIKWTWWQAMKRFKDKVVDNIPGPLEVGLLRFKVNISTEVC